MTCPVFIVSMKQLGGLGNTTKNNDERVVSAGEYNALKLKECTGQLTQPEFDKLLILDFNNLLAALPPILQPTEEIFDASKELAKVRVTPKANRRAVLENFKKKLFTQREAVAQCTVLLERALEFNPDTPPPDLRKIWHRFMATYRLGVESNSRIRQLIDDYYETREKMLGVRKQITDDKALVTAVTGVDVDSPNLKIVVGAMAFEIETDSINAHRIRNAITGEALPQDPIQTNPPIGDCSSKLNVYCYVLEEDDQNFVLWAQLENKKDNEALDKPGATCNKTRPDETANFNYCLTSPN